MDFSSRPAQLQDWRPDEMQMQFKVKINTENFRVFGRDQLKVAEDHEDNSGQKQA